jgi:DHA3 family tetracycline resistance protein-like MFS transporter
LDSYRFYLAARSTYALCWATIVTVNLVFMVEVAKLDPLQMVLVGTVLELSVFLFEIPTGVVADRVSRRLSVVIGHGLMGVGFFVIVLVPEFWMILVSQIIWGLGWTFISGAYSAWLTSEIGSPVRMKRSCGLRSWRRGWPFWVSACPSPWRTSPWHCRLPSDRWVWWG